MNKNKSNFSQTNKANPKIGTLFISLIILQSYVVPLIALAARNDLNSYSDYLLLYTITSYTIIVLGIIIFHNKGLIVLRDHYSLWAIVVACFLAAVLERENNTIYRVFLILLGLRLSAHIVTNRKEITTPDLKSVFVGLLWSAGTVAIIALLLALLNPASPTLPRNLLAYVLGTSLFQIAYVTVIEEACFRGLLFGLLVINGYQENKALLIQAVLFWGVHYLKISDTSLFFIAIPLLTISMTLITKKYKMLYLSIMIHTFANVLGTILVVVLQNSVL